MQYSKRHLNYVSRYMLKVREGLHNSENGKHAGAEMLGSQ